MFWAGMLGVIVLILGSRVITAQPYKDANAPVEERVRDLLSRMTLKEKFWQLFMLSTNLEGTVEKYTDGVFGFQISSSGDTSGSVEYVNSVQRHFVENTRLGIPIIAFGEAVHGLVHKDATVFPQAIALAATFDTSLMHRVSKAIALECRSRGIRQVLSPVVNIASDVRWGRVEETYGEDPYLSSEMGVAFVSELEKLGVITTPKHFIANVGDGGRDSYPIQFNERLLREIHLPPFEACILRGGSRSIMTSYNSLDGAPCTANDWLNNRLLKRELRFTGFVISDACAVGGASVLHFTAHDCAESTELALNGGLDVIFQTSYDHYHLFIKAFQDERLDQGVIDRAVSRVLRAKFELGLFERPYVDSNEPALRVVKDKHLRLAREAAQKSIVLLKNANNTLPLNKSIKTIAVIGPDASEARLGGYSGPGIRRISILGGIREKIGTSARISYSKGCDRISPEYVTVPSEYLFCSLNDTVRHGLIGEYFDNISLSGDPVFTRIDPQLQFQWTLFSPDPQRLPYDFYSVRWNGTLKAPASGRFKIGIDGNDGYRLYINGEPLIDNWRKVTRRTVLAEYHFEKGKEYDVRIEFFEPTGNAWFKLVWNVGVSSDWKREMDEAVSLAGQSDAAVVVAGIEEGEFRDRAVLGLPGRQEELINRVAATGKPVIVVLVGGSAITMNDWLDNVPAVLDVWYPGEQGGHAVADVLFGDYNPAGRLPVTFPVAEGQLPLAYNHKPTGRGDDYVDLTGQPLFPFGFGLSYTTFDYSDLSFDRQRISSTDSAVVRFKVKNTGTLEGDEVIQLYIHDEVASVARPVTELKGFERIHLKPGEVKEASFTIAPENLSMLDRDLEPVVEPGDFRIMIGSSSKDIRLRGILTVIK
ncbi:MAG: glycoside hydrolase family 3 C-terminal domain-containing protein [bacterium]|nr:MAG: glycoside hydrolase family 3 C-terminal domain-containing protein [bacterium]